MLSQPKNIILLPDDQAPLLYPFETGNDPHEFRVTTLTRSPTRISRLPDRSPDMALTPKIGVYFCYELRNDVGDQLACGVTARLSTQIGALRRSRQDPLVDIWR